MHGWPGTGFPEGDALVGTWNGRASNCTQEHIPVGEQMAGKERWRCRRRARFARRWSCAHMFGPVAFDAKGDADGMTYEMNVWRDAR